MFSMPIGNMTAKITNSVLLLPEKKMKPRVSDTRLGVFLTNKEYLSSKKDGIQPFTYANRWAGGTERYGGLGKRRAGLSL